jgi:hypothetical protein
MRRTILPAICGYALFLVLMVMTDVVAAAAIPALRSRTTRPPAGYLGFSLVTGLVYAAAGGRLCARVARERRSAATWALIVLGELIGLASTIASWKAGAHWYAVGLLVLFPFAVWLGARADRRGAGQKLRA